MPTDNTAIKVTSLSKVYPLFNSSRDRLKEALHPMRKKYHHDFYALKDVSFEIKKGEIVGIIGQNGSGKSTLLSIIAGVLTPSAGTVEVIGKVSSLLELGTGFNPELTGIENVYFNGTLLGFTRYEMDAKLDEILRFADIGEFVKQPVRTYSSGMYVRLAFSVAIQVDPEILVVDEALAVGDEKFQRKCFARIEEMKNNGTSILFVSHSPASIIELCSKALLLDHGTRLLFSSANKTIRAYQKLIYSPLEEQKRLAQEYRAMDKLAENTESEVQQEFANVSNKQHFDAFDPNLVPETTLVYPVQGAEIDGMQIFDAKGHIVNILQLGERYQFIVSGQFLTNLYGLYFGVHIRTVSGVEITGQRYPEEGKFFEYVDAGKSFKISFGFRMNVLPGVYFVGGGIWSSQEPNCVTVLWMQLCFVFSQMRKIYLSVTSMPQTETLIWRFFDIYYLMT